MDTVNNMTELCGRSAHRHVMLSADELKLKYGNIVRKEHKVALNQLIKTLNRDQTNVDITASTFKYSAALSKNERVIKRPEILSDLTGQSTEHLQSHSMNSVECSALQLLQQYHHAISKKSSSGPPKRKKGTPQKRPVRTAVAFTTVRLADELGVSPTQTTTVHNPKLQDTANAFDQLQDSRGVATLGKAKIGQKRCQSKYTREMHVRHGLRIYEDAEKNRRDNQC